MDFASNWPIMLLLGRGWSWRRLTLSAYNVVAGPGDILHFNATCTLLVVKLIRTK